MKLHPYTPAQAQQVRDYGDALKRDCPTCRARKGQPCMPSSLTIPHLARCRDDSNGAAA